LPTVAGAAMAVAPLPQVRLPRSVGLDAMLAQADSQQVQLEEEDARDMRQCGDELGLSTSAATLGLDSGTTPAKAHRAQVTVLEPQVRCLLT
jgi:hypothetical protein